VVNAVIHASAKQVQITAEAQGADVVLRVTNQGAPIPADRQASIFDPFVHTDTESSALPKRGLGLGLFIVKEIVTGHEGTVEVASTATEGTTFTVRLPRAPSSQAETPSSE
jgi:signal transduction histidine kinase